MYELVAKGRICEVSIAFAYIEWSRQAKTSPNTTCIYTGIMLSEYDSYVHCCTAVTNVGEGFS